MMTLFYFSYVCTMYMTIKICNCTGKYITTRGCIFIMSQISIYSVWSLCNYNQ